MARLKTKYRYMLGITALFAMFVAFVSPNNLIRSVRIKHNIRSMSRDAEAYRQQAKQDSLFLQDLQDDGFLEKYARENFYMKRKGEQIYLVVDK